MVFAIQIDTRKDILRCLFLSKADLEDTETLPEHIIPQNVQVTSAQMHTLNRSRRFNITWMAWSMIAP